MGMISSVCNGVFAFAMRLNSVPLIQASPHPRVFQWDLSSNTIANRAHVLEMEGTNRILPVLAWAAWGLQCGARMLAR